MTTFFLAVFLAVGAHAETLADLTAALKANPADQALREKVIAKAAAMKPRPAIPEEANRPFVKATVFQKEAKAPADYVRAVAAYDEALAIAPWWPEAYYNRSAAQAGAGKYDAAILSLKLYLLSRPAEKDAAEAKNAIYKYEAKKEIAEAAVAEKKTSFQGKWLCRGADTMTIELKEDGSGGYIWTRDGSAAMQGRAEGETLTVPMRGPQVTFVSEYKRDATGKLHHWQTCTQDAEQRRWLYDFQTKGGYKTDGGRYGDAPWGGPCSVPKETGVCEKL